MKTKANFSTSLRLATLLLSCLLVPLADAATLSVSPSSTSNTYSGLITLQIGGLTNAEPVVVQEFLDVNGNGIVDLGELLVDTFPINDGGASLIGGKTNLNVPFDGNAAGGAITTALPAPAQRIVADFVGRHIFRVLSPSDRFTPVDASFLVTNTAFSQSVTGLVFLAGAPAANAVVIALAGAGDGPYAGGTITDGAGRYSLKLPTNTYTLLASRPNCFFDAALAPRVALTSGVTATNNLYLTNGTVTLSGSVRDATNNAALGGVFMILFSGDYLATAFTASNGTFSAAVSPSFWQFEILGDRPARRGYVIPRQFPQFDTTTGAVANVTLQFPKANAMFHGRLADNLGAPFPGIEFQANDVSGSGSSMFTGQGTSDANGYYSVAVLGGTNSWYCSPNSMDTPLLANHVISSHPSVVLTAGQAYLQNFTALPVTATISGKVRDNLGNPVAGVGFGGGAFIGGTNYSTVNVLTDNTGNYTLRVVSGQWGVHFTANDPFSSDSLANRGLMDLFGQYQVTIPPANAVLDITVYPLGSSALGGLARLSPSQVGLNVRGSIGTNYTLQVSTNVAATNWSTVSSFQLPSSPFTVTDSQATNSSRFYRLLKN